MLSVAAIAAAMRLAGAPRVFELPEMEMQSVFNASAAAARVPIDVKSIATDGSVYVTATLANVVVKTRAGRNLPPQGKPILGEWRAEFRLVPIWTEGDDALLSKALAKYKVTDKGDLPNPAEVYIPDIYDGKYAWTVSYTRVEPIDEEVRQGIVRFIDELCNRVKRRKNGDCHAFLSEAIGCSDSD